MQDSLLMELKEILRKGKKYYLKKLLERYPKFSFNTQRQVILFGASELGKIFQKLCSQNKMEVIAFADNDISKRNKKLTGVKIISVKDLSDFPKNTAIIITSKFEEEIESQLKKLGYPNVWPYFYLSVRFPKKFHNIHWVSSLDVIFSNQTKIFKLFNLLIDEKSKRTLLNIIKYRLLLRRKYLKEISRPLDQEYYDKDLVNLSTNEIFIDGGAFDGDTVESFIKVAKNKFKKIYAFEPDLKLFNKLEKSITRVKANKIKLFKEGLGSKTTKLRFTNEATPGSRIAKYGHLFIKVVPLDKVIDNASFIKLDIEGAEIDALIGAKKLLRVSRPKLAVCVYHNPSDLWKIPFLIKKINPNYTLFFRHYGEFLYDTICYAL